MPAIIIIGQFILGFFQIAASVAGLEVWLGLPWLIALPLGLLLVYTLPLAGSLIGMLRVNRPGFMIYGGSMKPTNYKHYEKLDIISAFESYGQYVKGIINNEEREEIIETT